MGLKNNKQFFVNIGILGYGELGKAIKALYKGKPFNVYIQDKDTQQCFNGKLDILNVCIPYDKKFIKTVSDIIEEFKPSLTIIHSTVLPGTTKKIQQHHKDYVVHSPVRGNHPNLDKALYKFVKYIGSDTYKGYCIANTHLTFLGLQTKRLNDSMSTEMAKILCTSYYGMCIAWHGLVDKLCDRHGLNFSDIITEWNTSYNDGYRNMNEHQFIRPVLYSPKKKITGHCVIPNAKLLSKFTSSPLVKEILKYS